MAISVLDQPFLAQAGFNSQYLRLDSTNKLQPGFKYQARVTIGVPVSFTQVYDVVPLPGDYGYFDALPVARALPLQALPQTQYGVTGFQTDISCEMTIELGEYYSGVFHGYSHTYNYQIWPAGRTTLGMYNLSPDYANIWPGSGTPASVVNSMMQNLVTEKVYENTSTYFSVWNLNGGNFRGLRVYVYNKLTNALISSSDIYNPDYNSLNKVTSLKLINVGMSSLKSITPDLGASPILPSGLDYYYEVAILWVDGSPQEETVKRYIPTCDGPFPPFGITWRSRLGAWETQVFSGKSLESLNINYENYQVFNRVPYSAVGLVNPLYSNTFEKIRNIETQKTINLNTGWLSEADVLKCQDLLDSPQVYLVTNPTAAASQPIEVRPVQNSYTINKMYNKKKFQLNLDFRYAYKDNNQA